MSHVIFIEGMPGSGKSTVSAKYKQYLEEKGYVVKLFQEGDLHPVDSAWQAYYSKEEYDSLIDEYPSMREQLESSSLFQNEFVITAHHKLNYNLCEESQETLRAFLDSKNIFDLPFDEFKEINHRRWKWFTMNMDKNVDYYIFECIFFQNHISDLLLKHQCTNTQIYSYLDELIQIFSNLDKSLVYLKPSSIKDTLEHVSEIRKSNHPDQPDWIDLVRQYICNSALGKSLGWRTQKDLISFFEMRREIELEYLMKFPGNTYEVSYPSSDWETMNKELNRVLGE